MRFGPSVVEHLKQGAQIAAVCINAENGFATIAVQRLYHDCAMYFLEFAHFICRTGDDRRRHKLPIIEHHHFFGRVADAGGVVDHQCLILNPLKQMGGSDIADMKGRVLPHQHHVDIRA